MTAYQDGGTSPITVYGPCESYEEYCHVAGLDTPEMLDFEAQMNHDEWVRDEVALMDVGIAPYVFVPSTDDCPF